MNDLFLGQLLREVKWESFIPDPSHFYSSANIFCCSAGSMVAAAAFGGTYGLIGRVIYPQAGIIPFHYAIWFTVAFQIKTCINLLESHFALFLSLEKYFEKLESVSEHGFGIKDRIRYQCWKVIHLRTAVMTAVDDCFSWMFNVRPSYEVTSNNVEDSSFTEMCRFRIWKVFKATILDTVSSSLAWQMTTRMGFSLPNKTAVPLFIIIQSIVSGIFLLPSLHIYMRFCDHVANGIGGHDKPGAQIRAKWLSNYLPAL
jgi:hypothetical protein